MLPLEPPAYGRLRDIRSPALVMVGEYDISSALAEYEYQLDELPDATGYRFQDSAHLPSVERAAEFERVLLEWLGERGL
jgi:3-oxoadipate enol-lactonase